MCKTCGCEVARKPCSTSVIVAMSVHDLMLHDPALRDNPDRVDIPASAHKPHHMQEHVYDHAHPDVPDFLERFRELTDEYDAIFTVAEVGTWDPLALMQAYSRPSRLNSAYSFDFLAAPQLDTLAPREAQHPGVE